MNPHSPSENPPDPGGGFRGEDPDLERARRLCGSGRVIEAERLCRSVLERNPESARAWNCLGSSLREQGRLEESCRAYRAALGLRPDFPEALNNIGNVLLELMRPQAALVAFDEALQLKPDYPLAFRNRAMVLLALGRPEEALANCREALQRDPADREAHILMGILLLAAGDFQRGWPEYAWRLTLNTPPWNRLSTPAWDGAPLNGRTILTVAEQGLGDTIQFIRYAAILKLRFRCRVVAMIPQSLHRLLGSMPHLDQIVSSEEEPPPHDVFVPLMQVPALLGERLEQTPGPIPYLFPDEALVRLWRERLENGASFNVGIVWQGNPAHPGDRLRRFSPAALAPLARLRGIRMFSLQKGPGSNRLEESAGLLDVAPLGDDLDAGSDAYVDTAAVLRNLNLLITADTAVLHLAGALGTPAWLALSTSPDWRWGLAGENTAWYPSVRLFRQSSLGSWESVFERMAEELVRFSPRITPRAARDFRLSDCGSHRLARCRHGVLLFNRYDRYIGRSLDHYGEFSEEECLLFRQLLRTGHVVIEVGAHIGTHTLVFSRLVGGEGTVHAFEPQPEIYRTLCANMALNRRANVHCRCEAAGREAGRMYVPRVDYGLPHNSGGVALSADPPGEFTEVVTLDALGLPACHLLKVDAEGMEQDVLMGARETIRRCRPLLYLENDRDELSAGLIETALSLGYRLYWHLPPLFNPANFYGNSTNIFQGLVSVNMLGVPEEQTMEVCGLRRVAGPGDHWRNN
ncbi:MAG TPA: FkbM family methyltransferase [Acidobacteriota bacterium]|nr:FkbM family methyltransferase [Acidobacteriota bacterium]